MTKVRYLGGCCVEIIGLNRHIIIDPVYDVDPLSGINVVLFSTKTSQHFNLKVLRELKQNFAARDDLRIFAPKVLRKTLSNNDFGDCVEKIRDKKPMFEKGLEAKAFKLDCKNREECYGFTISKGNGHILHSSSSISFSTKAKKLQNKVDYAFIPSFEDHNQEYFDFVISINPKIVFPYNFRPGEENRAKKMAEHLSEMGLEAKFIEIGTEFNF